jgi:hypothetical protein
MRTLSAAGGEISDNFTAHGHVFYDIRAHPGPEKFTLSPFSGAQYCVTFKQREPLLLWSFLRVFAALLPWMCVRAFVYMCAGRKGTRVCQWQPVPADFSPRAAGGRTQYMPLPSRETT